MDSSTKFNTFVNKQIIQNVSTEYSSSGLDHNKTWSCLLKYNHRSAGTITVKTEGFETSKAAKKAAIYKTVEEEPWFQEIDITKVKPFWDVEISTSFTRTGPINTHLAFKSSSGNAQEPVQLCVMLQSLAYKEWEKDMSKMVHQTCYMTYLELTEHFGAAAVHSIHCTLPACKGSRVEDRALAVASTSRNDVDMRVPDGYDHDTSILVDTCEPIDLTNMQGEVRGMSTDENGNIYLLVDPDN